MSYLWVTWARCFVRNYWEVPDSCVWHSLPFACLIVIIQMHFQDLQDKLLFLSKSIWMLLFESSIQAIIHLRVSKFLALITSCSNEFLSLILHHMKTALLLISPNFATFPIIFCSFFCLAEWKLRHINIHTLILIKTTYQKTVKTWPQWEHLSLIPGFDPKIIFV